MRPLFPLIFHGIRALDTERVLVKQEIRKKSGKQAGVVVLSCSMNDSQKLKTVDASVGFIHARLHDTPICVDGVVVRWDCDSTTVLKEPYPKFYQEKLLLKRDSIAH